jgi:hypothetical protein
VKALMRGLCVASVMAAFLGLAGCGADNESEAEKLQKGLGAAPQPQVKGSGVAEPPPQTQTGRRDPMTSESIQELKKAAKR